MPADGLRSLRHPDFAGLMYDTGYYTWYGECDGRVYVIEVKRNRSTSEALNQIRDRPYGREHLSGKRSVVAIGLAFRKDENGVRVECRHRHAA